MEISASLVKELREKTGVGIMDCKKALKESEGNIDKAVDFLRQKGIATAKKRGGRATSEGQIQSYIHAGGKIGVLVEVNCETDFTGKTDEFHEMVRNIAMHIAASNPIAIDRDGIPPEVLEKEKNIYAIQAKESGKPEKVIDKIVEGKMGKFYSESCLLEQKYVKDGNLTVKQYLDGVAQEVKGGIEIKRFARFKLGEE